MARNIIYTTQVRDASNTLLSVLLNQVSLSSNVVANSNANGIITSNNTVVFANANDHELVYTIGYANATNYLTFKKIDNTSNPVTILANGSQTIDGSANVIITNKSSVILINDGTNWYIT